MLTVQRLKELFTYHEDGTLTYNIGNCKSVKGAVAGYISNSSGYVELGIDGITHRVHRLVWLYHYGAWPAIELDHIDRVRDNNRLSNLREATRSQQTLNVSISSANTSGMIGVHFHKKHRKWNAVVWVKGNLIQLYRGSNFDEACAARHAWNVQNNIIR